MGFFRDLGQIIRYFLITLYFRYSLNCASNFFFILEKPSNFRSSPNFALNFFLFIEKISNFRSSYKYILNFILFEKFTNFSLVLNLPPLTFCPIRQKEKPSVQKSSLISLIFVSEIKFIWEIIFHVTLLISICYQCGNAMSSWDWILGWIWE